MAALNPLTDEDKRFMQENSHLTASELSRILKKSRPRVAAYLRSIVGELDRKKFFIYKEKDIQYIKDNYKTITYKEIGKFLGCSGSAISRYVTKHIDSNPLKPNSKKIDYDFLDNYLKDNYKKLSIGTMAKELNISEKMVYYHKTRLNLPSYSNRRTYIELVTQEFLKLRNVKFKAEYSFGKFRYDFYLFDYNCFIECNGDYWHSNPKVYPEGPQTDVQKSNYERDLIKTELVKSKNKQLIVLWEKDIKDNTLNLEAYFQQEIIEKLASNNCKVI